MKKTLLSALVFTALTTSAAWADSRLHGMWKSVNADNGALHGTLLLEADGKLQLHPQGFDPAKGTWKKRSKNQTLELTLTDIGSTEVQYRWVVEPKKPRRLELTYDNGNKQLFSREKP